MKWSNPYNQPAKPLVDYSSLDLARLECAYRYIVEYHTYPNHYICLAVQDTKALQSMARKALTLK
jgi:hypothetical protein